MVLLIRRTLFVLSTLLLFSCASNPSLQKYYIDNSDNENFVSIDIPASVFKVKKDAPAELLEAIETVDKFNILAFVKKEGNEAEYTLENQKVKEIMKNGKYQELMRVKDKGRNIILKYEGGAEDKTLDEVILYAADKNSGFALVRILGDGMDPADIAKFAKNMDSFDFNGSEFEGLLKGLGKNASLGID